MANLTRESPCMKSAVATRADVQRAPASHDDGGPFPAARPIAPPKGPKGHVCYAEGVDLLAGNLFLPDQ
eukprot:6710175-Pyramimonas_sp.AAC.1